MRSHRRNGLALWSVAAILALPVSASDDRPNGQQPEEQIDREWAGFFTQQEEAAFGPYLRSQEASFDPTWSQVLQEDLDGDGTAEYVVTLLVPNAGGGTPRRAFTILKRQRDGYSMITHWPDFTAVGLYGSRKIYVLDFDGDGLEDVVDQRTFHIGGGEPEAYSLILKYDGDSLTEVYSKKSYKAVELVDLDDDSVFELIEPTNEFFIEATSALWSVVYRWDGTRWVDASTAFPDFYSARAAKFKEILDYARERNGWREESTGSPHPIYQNWIRAMETYLSRVEGITGSQ